ncbi:MAG TPA: hypothetical protein PLA13_04505 [Microbacteriaceae bacterium]|jgi:TRAP-type C4-dicarboxylate transport system permease small subunit|nr:hypothetical protein [Microbacteriaceae bacterium]HQX35600.1 hypothetical protein [Microbacteriaceae bacterium]HQZ48511.1 hypothetical protein [Microbacteriaceae bacterium]HRA09501.1 hypothetical protein [Microbacteriaceae bacterium]
MSTPSSSNDPQPGRIDRVLAFTAVGLVAVSIISMFVVLIARWLNPATDFSVAGWQFAANLPVFGLPIAFGMIVLLLIINFVRKARAGRKA